MELILDFLLQMDWIFKLDAFIITFYRRKNEAALTLSPKPFYYYIRKYTNARRGVRPRRVEPDFRLAHPREMQ